ncbi:MAG TPA: hypothetical protein GX513_03250 [Firmicutes bacterium]|nr:hypothetical protein [Bacillota bacterium]
MPLLLLGLVLAVAGGYAWGRQAEAQSAEPGTEADPLVTKSYVDDKLQALADKAYVEAYLGQRLQGLGLQVVELAAGKQLVAEGGTELILRAGKAVALGSNLGGVADLTAGKDLSSPGAKPDAVPLNHLLLVARSDGRGLKATVDCVVLVRGGFTVK